MPYYHSRTLDTDMDSAITRVTEALKAEGFGIITEIDIKETFRKKLDVDFRPYRILGACNPNFAYKALSMEDKVGTMLPCNVIVQQLDKGVEVAAVSPMASMASIDNPELSGIAEEVEKRLAHVVASL